jgi:hypothetical protein
VAEDILWQQYENRFRTFPRLIRELPAVPPQMIIGIPAYAEPDLINTLESLAACHHPGIGLEILVLFNEDDRMDDQQHQVHKASYGTCQEWIRERPLLPYAIHAIWLGKMESVKWGVGWARKLLMDEAARRMDQDGIIVNLDADCTIQENYLVAIWNSFTLNPDLEAASIYSEHPLDHLHASVRKAIATYELHLRYLVQAKRWAGHPFAYQTFGSAMAVRRKAYLRQGGMNTRQAGEDFYFLQKFIEIGSLGEINSTTVFPSSRKSLRVPFGTGKAMYQIGDEKLEWKTSSFESFRLIYPLLHQLPRLYSMLQGSESPLEMDYLIAELGLNEQLITFLTSIDFLPQCENIFSHTSSLGAFERRFFRFFNAFMMIRYLHYMRDHFFPDTNVAEAVSHLWTARSWQLSGVPDEETFLKLLRMADRRGIATLSPGG